MAQWLKYQTGDTTTDILNLDHVTRFRHVKAGDESTIEIFLDENQHVIMYSIDPDAYNDVMAYIRTTTGHPID